MRDRIAKLLSSVYPQADYILRVAEAFLLGRSMRGASGKLWNLGFERSVFLAPVDDDFELDYYLKSNLAFKITDRTCFT